MSPVALPDTSAERGIALVSVLWAISILSLIAVTVMSTSTLSYRMERNSWQRTKAETLANAGINRAVLGIIDPRPDKRWPVDGTPQTITLDNTEITLSVQDELGKIDINYATGDLLHRLLESAGVPLDQLDSLVARINDWRTSGGGRSINGANARDYESAGYSYTPRGSLFQSVDELQRVMGMTPEIFARLKPAITIYSQKSIFDSQYAPREALLALPGIIPDDVDEMLAGRGDGAGSLQFNGDALRSGVISPAIPLNGRAFTITADVSYQGVEVRRIVTLRLTGDNATPYYVLNWE